MSKRNRYIEALTDIAWSLRGNRDGGAIAWNVELLPGQVERELGRLRLDNEKLRRKVERLEAEREL